ncbi:MAG TPA: STAS domain-containing protein [Polyangiaceae bacterium]|nr:STAS domain-containing protein [Polyangiaceae bacterium]
MSEPFYMLAKPREDVLRVRLIGDFNQAAAARLERELDARWKDLFPGGGRGLVLMDLQGLTSCDIEGRAALASVQELFCRRGVRTAYVADQPRFRGLALWIAHLAGDAGAKALPTEAGAFEWLGLTTERVAEARKGSDTLFGGKAPPILGFADVAVRLAEAADPMRSWRAR